MARILSFLDKIKIWNVKNAGFTSVKFGPLGSPLLGGGGKMGGGGRQKKWAGGGQNGVAVPEFDLSSIEKKLLYIVN